VSMPDGDRLTESADARMRTSSPNRFKGTRNPHGCSAVCNRFRKTRGIRLSHATRGRLDVELLCYGANVDAPGKRIENELHKELLIGLRETAQELHSACDISLCRTWKCVKCDDRIDVRSAKTESRHFERLWKVAELTLSSTDGGCQCVRAGCVRCNKGATLCGGHDRSIQVC
jgi:hypothetical protein